MKCEEYRLLIEDHVDGLLNDQAVLRVTSHTAGCPACATFYQELRGEQDLYARYQRDVEVTPSLWASIETRIKQERKAEPRGLISRLRDQLAGAFSAPRLSPAFAAALVIIAIGTTVFVMSRLNSRDPVQVANNNGNGLVESPGAANSNAVIASSAPNKPQDGDVNVPAGGPAGVAAEIARVNAPAVKQQRRAPAALTPAQLVRDAEQKYLTAIAMLSRDVNRRRSQLDPALLARFDATLAEIDRSIKETRQVVRGNPEDPIALQYLLAAYSKKVDVLREMSND
jgi:anti-sigma factor RsiW